MDSVPQYEFHKIFQRVSYLVNLRGAYSPEEIDRRLLRAELSFREAASASLNEFIRLKLSKKAKALKTLRKKGFAEATIKEAVNNPFGSIGLTLHYGADKAEEMKHAFERARKRRCGIV